MADRTHQDLKLAFILLHLDVGAQAHTLYGRLRFGANLLALCLSKPRLPESGGLVSPSLNDASVCWLILSGE